MPAHGDSSCEEENAMNKEETRSDYAAKSERQPHRVRLPGFITDEEVGLGDVIKRATSTIGIRPCGGCERRAAALNRWLVFSGRRPQ
jgi:hypothetical protein